MVNDGIDYSRLVIRTELGEGTGDEYWQTADGQWWENWDGIEKTGQEVKILTKP